MRVLVPLCLLAALTPGLRAHETITTKLTWTRDIVRIFEKRCMNCHQAGGSAPFALTTWKEARPWAVAIREEVTARRMPPWNAVKGFGEFREEMALTQEEISLITDWANGGAPEGDPALAPGTLPLLDRPADLPNARPLNLAGSLLLATRTVLEGIRPESLPEGAAARVLLRRPDGSIEPLLWISDYRARFTRTYVFRRPIAAPAGSRVIVASPEAARFQLLISSRAASQDPAQAGE